MQLGDWPWLKERALDWLIGEVCRSFEPQSVAKVRELRTRAAQPQAARASRRTYAPSRSRADHLVTSARLHMTAIMQLKHDACNAWSQSAC